jgi:carboxylesterase
MPVELQPYADPVHQPFEFGDGAASALLIHGFPGTPAEMRPIGQMLGENGWRAQGILLPGFGEDIVKLGHRGREDWLSEAESAWLDIKRSSHPTILIGYSMGAAVALNIISAHPPDLLILIAPFWRLPGFLPRLAPVAKIFIPDIYPFRNADFSDPNLRDQFNPILPGVDLDDPEVQETIRTEFRLSVRVIDEILNLGKKAYQHANQVQIPTLVIQGNKDPLVRPSETIKLVKRIGSKRVDYHELDGDHDLIQDGSINRTKVNELILREVNRLR